MIKKPNRLINEKNPYLLQHANNPVDWYPWGQEALNKSRKEDKLIFLSIGYSTCHWCHEMAHDAFSDEKTAEYLNDNYVSIKVDREERPDIDEAYMLACQLLSENCGWPLNIIMTPDKKPIFAATFLPSQEGYGRRSFLSILQEIQDMWHIDRNKILNVGDLILTRIDTLQKEILNEEIDKNTLEIAFELFSKSFDRAYGGFGVAPKFPTPHNLVFLLEWYKKNKEAFALEIVSKTLTSMAQGGIFDHVGGGFHRYSTDRTWMIPHFEKMLYDQALIANVYIEAYEITKDELYADVAKETLDFVLNEMTNSEGGFYSGLDADSEGEEGRFYVWTKHDIYKFLDADAELFCEFFGVTEIGNLESGNNVLFVSASLDDVASKFNMTTNSVKNKLHVCLKKLYEARNKRIRPNSDDKVITSWNGLIIQSLALAGKVFNDERYKKAAIKAANFVIKYLITLDGTVIRSYFNGSSNILGFLEDYSFFIYGILELYNTTSDETYLELAKNLADKMIAEFYDKVNGGFYFTSINAEAPIIRIKYVADQAIPSGNSIAALVLLKLGAITNNENYTDIAKSVFSCFGHNINQSPINYSQFMIAFMNSF